MGIEPIYFYKQYLNDGSNKSGLQVNTIVAVISNTLDAILYEPSFTYFPVDQQMATTPAEQLIVSAKFNKSSN